MTDNGNNGPEAPQSGAKPEAAPEGEIQNNDAGVSGQETAPEEEKAPLTPEAEIEALKAKLADAEDRYLRSHAEMENLRKRTERELANRSKYAVQKFAESVLTVGDNIERALKAVPEEEIEHNNTLKILVEGIRVTERELTNVLERYGVKAFDALGAQLDPNIHSAMFEIESSEVPAGTILQVVQQGYMIGDRLLRPAQVGVAKAVAVPEPQTAGDAAQSPVAEAANDDQAEAASEASGQPAPGSTDAPAAATGAAPVEAPQRTEATEGATEEVTTGVPNPNGNRGENI